MYNTNMPSYFYMPSPPEQYDGLLFEAGMLVVEKERASIGMFQRTFKISFNRASQIMDTLNDYGVVGEECGTKPRKVLMTKEEFNTFVNSFDKIAINHNNLQSHNRLDNIPELERVHMYNNKYDYMNGHDFEYFCAELLSKNDFYDIALTPESGDQGIDIIAYKDGAKFGIQCKCYSSDIGNSAVQEAFAGAKFYDCHVPVVLTNRYFTPSAIDLAQKTNVVLWDRDKLENMIN